MEPQYELDDIDEKVQCVLGHFQKDFERGISAENLGSKYGGYGSFLPTFQSSPPVLSQPKSPPRFHSHNPKHSVTEEDERVQRVLGDFQKDFEGRVSAENLGSKFGGYGSFLPKENLSPPKNSIGSPKTPLSQRKGVAVSGNSHSVLALRGAFGGGSVRKELHLPSAQVGQQHQHQHRGKRKRKGEGPELFTSGLKKRKYDQITEEGHKKLEEEPVQRKNKSTLRNRRFTI